MKKLLSLFILLFAVLSCFSQESKTTNDTIGLNEVIVKKVSNRKEISTIIKKIKHNLIENYETEPVNYITNYFSLHNKTDTLVNRKMLNVLNIKSLNFKNISWMLNGDSSNPFHRDTSPYFEFEPTTSENHWLALSIFYDSLKVIDFDFFDMNKFYKYSISREGDVTTVTFKASRYYCGYFTFNSINYNLIRIAFKNTNPYDYYVDGYSRIIDSYLEFTSQWSYNKVTVLLDFAETDKGKLLLKKLNAMQELTKFRSIRFDYTHRIIARYFNSNFYTTLNMRILE